MDLLLAPDTALFLVPLYSGVRDKVFAIPGAPARETGVHVPVTIVGTSAKDAWPRTASFENLLAAVAAARIPEGLDELCFALGSDWYHTAEASGVGQWIGTPRPSDLLHHGLPHLLRTAFLAVRIGLAEGLPIASPEIQALWYAGLLHDFRRSTHERSKGGHAEDSAAWSVVLLDLNGIDLKIIAMAARAIRDHVRPRAEVDATISLILRDADALERFRLASDGCDSASLTFGSAKALMPVLRAHYYPGAPGSR